MVKHSYQTQFGRVNIFFLPLLPRHNPSLIKVRSGTQASNLKGGAMEEQPVASSYGLLSYKAHPWRVLSCSSGLPAQGMM